MESQTIIISDLNSVIINNLTLDGSESQMKLINGVFLTFENIDSVKITTLMINNISLENSVLMQF
jgi:hypothetical protein